MEKGGVASLYSHILSCSASRAQSDAPRRCHLSSWPSTRRTFQMAQEATISPETESSAKGSWPFTQYISFVQAVCALEENLLTLPKLKCS